MRLPLAAVDPEELPPIDDGLRVPFERACIAIVAIDPRDLEPAVAGLRAAATASGRACVELRAALRDGPVSIEGSAARTEIAAPLLELPEAIARASAELPAHDLLLATGVGLVAIRRPEVSVLVTRGRAPSDWPADVRSVRHRFELIVPELDAHLARELVARVGEPQRPFSSS